MSVNIEREIGGGCRVLASSVRGDGMQHRKEPDKDRAVPIDLTMHRFEWGSMPSRIAQLRIRCGQSRAYQSDSEFDILNA